MALHRLSSFTYQVPDVATVTSYYEAFGLANNGDGSFSTTDGGRQLFLEQGPYRRITSIELGADDQDDLGRIASALKALDIEASVDGDTLTTMEPVMHMGVRVAVQPRLVQAEFEAAPVNGPTEVHRVNTRASAVHRTGPVRPRRLGHVALMSGESESSLKFFVDGLGFKVSDYAGSHANAFLRCSTDHHNVAVFGAPANLPHHSSWQVDDLDEIGRGAEHMLMGDEERRGWGFGRHYAGSNFFWYLKDPAGTFSEYYADMDQITDDDLWTPEMCEGKSGLYNWGPPLPPDFMAPQDLAEIIAAQNA